MGRIVSHSLQMKKPGREYTAWQRCTVAQRKTHATNLTRMHNQRNDRDRFPEFPSTNAGSGRNKNYGNATYGNVHGSVSENDTNALILTPNDNDPHAPISRSELRVQRPYDLVVC